jgi:hypothetical protein
MHTRVLAMICLIIITQVGFAQQKKQNRSTSGYKEITSPKKGTPFFINANYDFGVIQEERGLAKARFYFKNIGAGAVSIRNIDVSCGCTATEWSTKLVGAGEESEILVTYDPKGRPGDFNKLVTVHFNNAEPDKIYLSIKGIVTSESEEIIKTYPFIQGNIRLSTINPILKEISENALDSFSVAIINTSGKRLSINGFKTPSHIEASSYHKLLLPGAATYVFVKYNAAKAKDIGERIDEVVIATDDDSVPLKRFIIKSTIVNDYKSLPAEVQNNPPKTFLSKAEHDFGVMYLGEKATYEFEIINKGKSDLVIKKAVGTCGCTITNVREPIIIKKKKKGKIAVSFDSANQRGVQEKLLTVYTNDPARPIFNLRIKAKVIIPGEDPLGK